MSKFPNTFGVRYMDGRIHIPTHEEMNSASFNPRYYNYTIPFRPIDQVFENVASHFPDMGIQPYYWIGSYGFLYNSNTKFYATPRYSIHGSTYSLTRTAEYIQRTGLGLSYTASIGILVCTCFNGPKPDNSYVVGYRDGNKENNYYKNVLWVPAMDCIHNTDTYWDNSCKPFTCNSDQINSICRLLQDGIVDVGIISNTVFGCLPTLEIYNIIYKLRRQCIYPDIVKNYKLPKERRVITPDIIIHSICRYMRDNPHTAYIATLDEILAYSNINYLLIPKKELDKYSESLEDLRHHNAYRRIADQYNIPKMEDKENGI